MNEERAVGYNWSAGLMVFSGLGTCSIRLCVFFGVTSASVEDADLEYDEVVEDDGEVEDDEVVEDKEEFADAGVVEDAVEFGSVTPEAKQDEAGSAKPGVGV